MTILAHGTMAAAIAYTWTQDPLHTLFFFFLGITNDSLRKLFREPTWNGTYLLLHRPDIYFSKLGRNPKDAWYIYALWIIVFPIGLHALVDWYLHKESGGWYWYAYPVELSYWIGFYYTGIPTDWYNNTINFYYTYLHSNFTGVF